VAKEQHMKLSPAEIGVIPKPVSAAVHAKACMAEEQLTLVKQDNQAAFDLRIWSAGADCTQLSIEVNFVNRAFATATAAVYVDAGYIVSDTIVDGKTRLKLSIPQQLFK
jgi:hypothetical protein